MPRKIPLPAGLPHFDLQARLDDVTYTLEVRWNVRASAWYMNVFDAEGAVLLLAGARLVVDFPLFGSSSRTAGPPGMLTILDTTGRHADPDFAALGTTAQLTYVTKAELQIGPPYADGSDALVVGGT